VDPPAEIRREAEGLHDMEQPSRSDMVEKTLYVEKEDRHRQSGGHGCTGGMDDGVDCIGCTVVIAGSELGGGEEAMRVSVVHQVSGNYPLQ
jgi:hypothetical protein